MTACERELRWSASKGAPSGGSALLRAKQVEICVVFEFRAERRAVLHEAREEDRVGWRDRELRDFVDRHPAKLADSRRGSERAREVPRDEDEGEPLVIGARRG